MKKLIILLLLSLPFMVLGQEIKPSKSFGEGVINMEKFLANVQVKNSSSVEILSLRPDTRNTQMYLSGNFGTLDEGERPTFTSSVVSNTIKFIYVNRVMSINGVLRVVDEDGDIIKSSLLEDLMAKKILAIAEFDDPETGQRIRKNVELNLTKESEPGEEGILASAEITDEVLGLRTRTLVIKNHLGLDANISNPVLGSFAIKSGELRSSKFLGSKEIPDGIYKLDCHIRIPGTNFLPRFHIYGLMMERELEIFSIFGSPADTTGNDYSLVTFRNNSSASVTMFIPKQYVGERKGIFSPVQNVPRELVTQGIEWEVVSLPPRSSAKVYLRKGLQRAIRYTRGVAVAVEYSIPDEKTHRTTIM